LNYFWDKIKCPNTKLNQERYHMNFQDLPPEILVIILSFLTDKNKFVITSISKYLYSFRRFLTFTKPIHLRTFYRVYAATNYANCFQHIRVEVWENDDTKKIIIPPQTKYLEIGFLNLASMVVHKGYYGTIPSSVTHLKFISYFDHSIKGLVPSSVTHLSFNDEFDRNIKGDIPYGVTHLLFGSCFNKDITNAIPSSVTHLTFGRFFRHKIDNLPPSITHLTLDYYNMSKQGKIPSSVTHLTFGEHFNEYVVGMIPNSVTHLVFGNNFNQNIQGAIPFGVTHLVLGAGFHHDIRGAIPNSVTHLIVPTTVNKCVPAHIEHVRYIPSCKRRFKYYPGVV